MRLYTSSVGGRHLTISTVVYKAQQRYKIASTTSSTSQKKIPLRICFDNQKYIKSSAKERDLYDGNTRVTFPQLEFRAVVRSPHVTGPNTTGGLLRHPIYLLGILAHYRSPNGYPLSSNRHTSQTTRGTQGIISIPGPPSADSSVIYTHSQARRSERCPPSAMVMRHIRYEHHSRSYIRRHTTPRRRPSLHLRRLHALPVHVTP